MQKYVQVARVTQLDDSDDNSTSEDDDVAGRIHTVNKISTASTDEEIITIQL